MVVWNNPGYTKSEDDTRRLLGQIPCNSDWTGFPAKVRPNGMGKRYSVGGWNARAWYACCVRAYVCVLSVGDLDESQAGAMINS